MRSPFDGPNFITSLLMMQIYTSDFTKLVVKRNRNK